MLTAQTSKREKSVKKVVNLNEGEASLIIPDDLSIDSCEKLEAWLTGLLMETRANAAMQQGLARLHTSMVASVANDDDDGTK